MKYSEMKLLDDDQLRKMLASLKFDLLQSVSSGSSVAHGSAGRRSMRKDVARVMAVLGRS